MRISKGVWVGGSALLALVLLFAAYVAFRFFTHGPPALTRATLAPPTAVLRYGGAASQRIEVRRPAGQGPFPAVVLIHGGCWSTRYGNVEFMAPLADALRNQGIATFNIGYRRVGKAGGGWPGKFRDFGAAIDSVRGVARQYDVDPEQIVVVGHSAGALLALWTATRKTLARSSDLYAQDPAMPMRW